MSKYLTVNDLKTILKNYNEDNLVLIDFGEPVPARSSCTIGGYFEYEINYGECLMISTKKKI